MGELLENYISDDYADADCQYGIYGCGFFYSIQQHPDEPDFFYHFKRFLFCGVCDVVALFYRSVRHIDDYYFDNEPNGIL